MTPSYHRSQLPQHALICASGGVLIGGIEAITCAQPDQLPAIVLGWSVLGGLLPPLLWPFLRRRAWWTTPFVITAGLITAGLVAGLDIIHHAAFLAPLGGMMLTAVICHRAAAETAVPGHCRHCDYNLWGLPNPRCPECGTRFEPAIDSVPRPPRQAESPHAALPSRRNTTVNPMPPTRGTPRFSVTLVIALGLFGYAPPLYAQTHFTVDANGTGDFTAIQAAIDATVSDLGAYEYQAGSCPTPGDVDGNGIVDTDDFDFIATCLAGPGMDLDVNCTCGDLNHDGASDLLDLGLFQRRFNGSQGDAIRKR